MKPEEDPGQMGERAHLKMMNAGPGMEDEDETEDFDVNMVLGDRTHEQVYTTLGKCMLSEFQKLPREKKATSQAVSSLLITCNLPLHKLFKSTSEQIKTSKRFI